MQCTAHVGIPWSLGKERLRNLAKDRYEIHIHQQKGVLVPSVPAHRMASRNNRISEGHLPLYGKTELGAADHMTFWRQRMHNEQVGCPEFDRFGSNAGLSLLWRPDAPRQPQTMYAHASHKRHVPPEFRDIGSAAAAARGAPRLPPTAAAALGSVMPPARTPLPAQATPPRTRGS